jgi:hypothetical protein
MYSLEHWYSAKPSNIKRKQTFQFRTLWQITNPTINVSIHNFRDLVLETYDQYPSRLS